MMDLRCAMLLVFLGTASSLRLLGQKTHRSLIDAVFVINMDSRVDKMQFMNQTIQKLNVPCMRWGAAILELDFEQKTNNELFHVLKEPDVRLSRWKNCTEDLSYCNWWEKNSTEQKRQYYNTMGNFASHLSVIHYISTVGRPGGLYLVMEDDHEMLPQLDSELPNILAMVNDPDWNAIRLDCWGSMRKATQVSKQDRATAYRTQDHGEHINGDPYLGGTHAILYNYDGIQEVLNAWQAPPWHSSDNMFWTSKFRSYCVNGNPPYSEKNQSLSSDLGHLNLPDFTLSTNSGHSGFENIKPSDGCVDVNRPDLYIY